MTIHTFSGKQPQLGERGFISPAGAQIEDRVILAAGALVPPGKVLVSGFLYKGSPAAAARALSDAELDYFRYTAGNYVKLKDQYISEGLGE